MSAPTRLRIVATLVSVVLMVTSMRAAQSASSLSGPVLGYLFDRNTGKLRPVRGILGSATIGAPVEASFAISQLFPLDARYGIASIDSSSDLVALTLAGGQSSTVVLAGIPANPTRGALSLQGSAAAFQYPGAQEVRIVTGLPLEPHQAAIVPMDKAVTQMAVNHDGTVLVYAVREGEGEAIYAWTANSGNPRFVTSAVSVSGIAISRSGDAIVTDRGANEVFAIWDVAGGAVRRLLVNEKEGVSEPVGVALSSGNRIYIANAGSVMVLDSNGRFLKAHACNCTISGMYPFRDSVFRLTDDPGRTTFLLDTSFPDERIVFVPPPKE